MFVSGAYLFHCFWQLIDLHRKVFDWIDILRSHTSVAFPEQLVVIRFLPSYRWIFKMNTSRNRTQPVHRWNRYQINPNMSRSSSRLSRRFFRTFRTLFVMIEMNMVMPINTTKKMNAAKQIGPRNASADNSSEVSNFIRIISKSICAVWRRFEQAQILEMNSR